MHAGGHFPSWQNTACVCAEFRKLTKQHPRVFDKHKFQRVFLIQRMHRMARECLLAVSSHLCKKHHQCALYSSLIYNSMVVLHLETKWRLATTEPKKIGPSMRRVHSSVLYRHCPLKLLLKNSWDSQNKIETLRDEGVTPCHISSNRWELGMTLKWLRTMAANNCVQFVVLFRELLPN